MHSPTNQGAGNYRLAGIDLDGTLLGPDHRISEENKRAIARLQAAGVEVVLASGRHHTAMQAFARELPPVRWMVSAQGAEASRADRSEIVHQSFMPAEVVLQVLGLARELKFPALVYAHEGIITDDDAAVASYEALLNFRPGRVTTEALGEQGAFKVVLIGEPDRVSSLVGLEAVKAVPTDTVRSHRHLFEFIQRGVSKATGMERLVQHLGIRQTETMAFGDAENDLPLFDWVRTSVAMPHGWPSVLPRATLIGPKGPPETAFARAVDLVLSQAG